MAGIGVGTLWIAYFLGLWGYCLIRGYNVSPKQLLSSSWPPGGTATSGATSSSLAA